MLRKWLRRPLWPLLSPALGTHRLERWTSPLVPAMWRLNRCPARGFAMPAAILNQMGLLGRRYDELAHKLSQYVRS